MKRQISLRPMTKKMYHRFFKKYQNDPDLFLDKKDFKPYVYDKKKVDVYIKRQTTLRRLPFAICLGYKIVGELKIYNIVEKTSATLGISMINDKYKNKGFGTQAERLAIDYVFNTLDIPVLYADSILTNLRSQHVLEKVGFRFLHQDDKKKYYCIERKSIYIK